MNSFISKGFKIAVMAVALSSFATVVRAEQVWTYSNWLPAGHRLNEDAVFPWARLVEKVTEGRVKIKVAPKAVGTPPAQYDVVHDGLAEVGMIVPGYTPGRFDLVTIGEGPFLTERADVAAPAFARFYEKWLKPLNLFDGVHIASAFVTSPGQIFTKKPIKSIADFAGLKLRSPLVGTIATIEAIGAVPVQKNVSESYEMLSAGTLDGSFAGVEQAKSYHLADVTSHLTVVPGALYNSVLLLVINKAAWDKVSEKDQVAIEAISGEHFAKMIGDAFMIAEQEGLAEMKAKGGTVSYASPELTAEIKAALSENSKKLVEKAESLGLKNAAVALAEYQADIKAIEASITSK